MKVIRIILSDKNARKLGDIHCGTVFELADNNRSLYMKLFPEKCDMIQFVNLGTGIIEESYKSAIVRIVAGSFIEEEIK